MILPTRLFFLLFQFLLVISTLSETQTKLPSWAQIDEMYSKLFGLPIKKEQQTVDELTEANVPKELDQNLIFEIEASVFANEIEEILKNASIKSLNEEQNKILEKKRKNFKEFFGVAEEKRRPTMSRVCELWKFGRQIGDEFVKYNLLDGHRKNQNEKRKIIAVPKKINCSKIEQLINEKIEWIQVYLEEIVTLHLSVLKNLAMKKYDNGQKREFTNLFEPEMMPNESNFVFQLRLLHANANSTEILRRIKRKIIQHLIGLFVHRLEIYAPANFAPEIVDDQCLAEAYMEIIFKNDQMASINKQNLDMRIYLGRIWHILGAFYRHKKAGGNISEKDNDFLNERSQKFFSLNEHDNRFPLAYCHDTWYRMAKLYNEIIAIGTEENGEKKAIEIKNGDAQTIEAMQNEVIEDHVINILQLMRSSNAFSDHFRNANKESKRKLKIFLAQTMFIRNNATSDKEVLIEYEQLMDKFPSLRDLLRNELTAKQIEEKQIKYYIDILDSKNDKKVWKLAQFLLDILAYCQWFHFFDDQILNEQLKNSIGKRIKQIEIYVENLEASRNYPSQAKSYMFSFIVTAQKEVALFMAQNENGGEKMPTDKQIDDGTALKTMHEQIVWKLLNNKAFRDKLKKIEINKKRMSDLIGDGTEIGNNLLSESHKRKFEPKGKEIIKMGNQKETQKAAKGNGQKQNETPKSDEQIFVPLFADSDLYNFAYIYKQVLINHINDSAIKEFNVHVTHFRYKDTLNALIWKIFTMETAQNEKLERIRTLILDIAQIENFGEKLANTLEEKKKICSMESFFNWITQNDTLYSESAEWRSFLATISPKTEAMAENVQPSDSDFVWHKMDCENAENYDKVFEQETKGNKILKLHMSILLNLIDVLPDFYTFSKEKANEFATIKKLSEEKKVASFYENIFDAQNTEAARAKEMELALIRAIQHILLNDQREKTAVQSQRQKDEPHIMYLFMVLSVLDLFDDEVPARRTARMICMALPSAKETTPKGKRQRNAKRGTTIRQLVEKCLDNDIQNIERQTFADQREMSAQWHGQFFAHYLPNFPANDPLLKRIRQTVGALHTLNLLMGGDELDNLMANNEFVPAKLVDKNLFTNKNHLLLAHYSLIVRGGSQKGVDRLSARLMADLLVLMDNTDQISAQIGSKHLTNLWLLNFRLLYETVAAEAENAPKCALLLRNLLEEMDKFLDCNKKLEIGSSNSKANIGIVWFMKWKEANGRTEIQWHGQKHEQMVANNEKVQKMHMDKLGKQLASEKGGENDEFEQILHKLKSSSNFRRNLLQILTEEDAKEFLKINKIKFEKSEFKIQKNKISEEKGNKNWAKNKLSKKENKKKMEKIWSTIEKGETSKTEKKNLTKETSEEVKSDERIDEEKSDQKIEKPKNDQKIEKEKSKQKMEEPKSEGEKSDQKIEKENSDQKIEEEKSKQKMEEPKSEGEKSDQKIEKEKVDELGNSESIDESVNKSGEEASNVSQKTEYDIQSEEMDEKWNKIERKRTESQRKRQSQRQKQLISAKVINATLSDLCENEPLVQKYKNEILHNMQPNAMNILNLCAFKNEIEKRIQMLKETSKIIGNEAKIGQNLISIWEENSKMKMERQNDLIIWEEKLSEILQEILMHQNGQWQNLTNAEFNEFKTENYEQKRMIWQNLRSQIHLKNILMAFEEKKELAKSWEKFGTETKWKKLNNLTRQMPILQFNALVKNYRKMGEQIEIDQELFASSANNHFEEGHYLPPNFAKISQQITILNPMLVANEAAKEFENYLTSNVFKNIYVQQNFYRIKMEGALQQIVTVVEKWSNGLAQLLISGSLLLHSHTIGSDVNLVCLTPGEKLKVSDFMGNDRKSKCEENKCTDEANSSLFCQICAHKSTTNLIKIESDSLLIVRFQFDGIEFDISLVAIPKIEQLEKINAEMLQKLAEKFNDSIFEQKNMGRTLASYRSTLFVANLFYHPIKISNCLDSFRDILARQQTMSENGRNFRHLLIATKFWAKNNYIYSNKMGFLNGISLAIMVAKIGLLFPNSSLQFLLENFFLIYLTRPQQIPIQLTKIDAHNFNLFVAMNEKELEMPVLTPELQFHPLQNATRFVTHSNAKVIRREMAQALQKVNSLKNDKFNLGAFLSEPIPFTEKFQNFLVIHCISEQKELADSFCDFVEWRMRLQIIFSIDKKDAGGQSVATHLKPNIHREKCNLTTAKLLGISFRPNFCKVWLLGIISHPIKNRDEIISMPKHFDSTIKSHFHQRQNRENSAIYWLEVAAKLELKTMLMSREELVKLEKDEEEEK